ncbi:MAG: polysaccharide deacetylase family protein [Hyphomicrobiaceae bacterium]|nr:polysaccharide deacetylase family protein [Hyphomicrobiaceae bacterium]
MNRLLRSTVTHAMHGIHMLGIHKVLARRWGGRGIILMLHRVQPAPAVRTAFAPNAHLSITPDFLATTIGHIRQSGFDIVSLDEAIERLRGGSRRKFAVLTLDDGYRDNLEHAYGVFRALDAPFTIYVPSSWPSGGGELWWRVLEDVIAANDEIEPGVSGLPDVVETVTGSQKLRLFVQINKRLNTMSETSQRMVVRDLAARYGVDLADLCRAEIMSWDELRQLSRDKLATIGAHTISHPQLTKLSDAALDAELLHARLEIERQLGLPCRHLAYPYGDSRSVGKREHEAARRAGFRSAVTTTNSPIYERHGDCLFSLPRVAIDGDRQTLWALDVQASGVVPALRAGFARLALGKSREPSVGRRGAVPAAERVLSLQPPGKGNKSRRTTHGRIGT